jgi:hypothetical protein
MISHVGTVTVSNFRPFDGLTGWVHPDSMSGHPPQSTKAHAPISLYRIRKEASDPTRSRSGTLSVELITRAYLGLVGHDGWFVRHDRCYQKLHPKSAFRAFIKEHGKTTLFISVAAVDRHYYDPEKDQELPFIVEWEDGIATY